MRIFLSGTIVGVLLFCQVGTAMPEPLEGEFKDDGFMATVESGKADPDHFVSLLAANHDLIREVSPNAAANYMEALANEGLLNVIPPEYFQVGDIWISLQVVFEHPMNVSLNRSVYEEYEQLGTFEEGSADSEVFISAVKQNPLRLRELSPPAVANYMEALANEEMLRLVPQDYLVDDVIQTALTVVFEHPSNVVRNWSVFEDYMDLVLACH